jgi:Leucine-rich repeat (LRR) protein
MVKRIAVLSLSIVLIFSMVPSFVDTPQAGESVRSVAMTTELTQWVLDEPTGTLFAVSSAGRSLLCIDSVTLQTEQSIALNGSPSDITASEGKLYIALPDKLSIAIVDIAGRTIDKSLTTVDAPFQIAVDGDRLFYAAESDCLIREYNLATDTDKSIIGKMFWEPDIAVNATDHLLYIGESGVSSTLLTYYSITESRVVSQTPFSWSYALRGVLYNGTSVFYDGKAFDATSPMKVLGDFSGSDPVLFGGAGCVFTATAVYDEATHRKAGNLAAPVRLVESTDSGRFYLYDNVAQRITMVVCSDDRADADEIIDLTGGTPAPEIPAVTRSEIVAEGQRSLAMASDLKDWVLDDATDTLFAISLTDKALFFIDAVTLDILETIRFRSAPTDIVVDNGKLYVPLCRAYQIAVIDIASRMQIDTLYTLSDPNQIAVDGDMLYYAEEDQHCYIYSLDMTSGIEKKLNIGTRYYPALAFNADDHILYIGESNSSRSTVSYYDTVSQTLIGISEGFDGSQRSVIYDGSYVFYAEGAFDATDPSVSFGMLEMGFQGRFILARYGIVFTNNSLYYFDEVDSFVKLLDFDAPIELAALSDHLDLFLYDKEAGVILREEGQGLPPTVYGVSDGMGYIAPVTITFDKGTALLDGEAFESGGTVGEPGEHVLVVSDGESPETVVTFYLYAPMEGDALPVVFPDPALEAALMSNGVDADEDGVIVQGEMRIFTADLYLSYGEITNLDGLEHATNVRGIDLSGNALTDISALSGLTALEMLDLSGNLIVDIQPLAGLEALGLNDGWLYLADNGIVDIGVLAGLPNLSDLDLSRNPISDFSPLTDITTLQYLALNGNHLSDLAFLEKLTAMTFLDLSENDITDISLLQGMTDLFYLSLYSNAVQDLSALEDKISLYVLDLSDNEIYDIGALLTLDPWMLDLSGNYLDLDHRTDDSSVIESLLERNAERMLLVTPQKELPEEYRSPVITIGPYGTDWTNKDIVVSASTDKGTLNASSHRFTQNGTFEFVSTDSYGNTTYEMVEIANIDKVAPKLTVVDYNKNPTTSSVTVTVTSDEGMLNAGSHVFTTNGSFDFVATDLAGNRTVLTITISNIYKLGDVNGDRTPNGLDLLKLKKHILGQITLTGLEFKAADINRDGKVDGLDLLKLKKFLLGQSGL